MEGCHPLCRGPCVGMLLMLWGFALWILPVSLCSSIRHLHWD